jgi:hypothetical protein
MWLLYVPGAVVNEQAEGGGVVEQPICGAQGGSMTGPCKCPICNAPDDEPSCFDCHHIFTEHEEQFEDRLGNPQCFKCYEKLIDQADAIRKALADDEALKREMDGRKADRRESDRINGRY